MYKVELGANGYQIREWYEKPMAVLYTAPLRVSQYDKDMAVYRESISKPKIYPTLESDKSYWTGLGIGSVIDESKVRFSPNKLYNCIGGDACNFGCYPCKSCEIVVIAIPAIPAPKEEPQPSEIKKRIGDALRAFSAGKIGHFETVDIIFSLTRKKVN